jgi:hypothetical protein
MDEVFSFQSEWFHKAHPFLFPEHEGKHNQHQAHEATKTAGDDSHQPEIEEHSTLVPGGSFFWWCGGIWRSRNRVGCGIQRANLYENFVVRDIAKDFP